MKIATTNFSMQRVSSPNEFWRRFRIMVEQAKGYEAELVLFPEYFSLPWLLAEGGNFKNRLLAAGDLEARFVEEVRRAATEFRIGIIAGTFPHMASKDDIRNRSWICLPGKEPFFQDKVNMTRFETGEWNIRPGASELKIFPHLGARCAVAICYDVEFPAYCAAAAESNVDILFVPTCTESMHGYWRVRHCASARAVENQSFVVLSCAVEGDSRYPEIGAHYGKAMVLSPCDIGFPEAGIVAETKANVEEVLGARVELRALQEVRKNGTVLNLADSRRQERFSWKE